MLRSLIRTGGGWAVLLLATGCGVGVPLGELPDGGSGMFAAGSRLRPKVLVGEDGSRVPLQLQAKYSFLYASTAILEDTQRGEDCAIASTVDGYRCLPTAFNQPRTVYRDAQCSEAVLTGTYDPLGGPGQYFFTLAGSTTVGEVRRLGDSLGPASLFFARPCAALQATELFYALSEPIPLSDFARYEPD